MSDDEARPEPPPVMLAERMRLTLAKHGLAAPGHGFHGWRCEYPDKYGPCHCGVTDLIGDLLATVADDTHDKPAPRTETTGAAAAWPVAGAYPNLCKYCGHRITTRLDAWVHTATGSALCHKPAPRPEENR